jgi:predicted transposase/invertase (TIGR01784 family)
MEHMDYIRKMMAYSDSVHSLEFAKKKGLEEGMRKGKQEAAQSMLAEGLDPALVARITKLPKKQIMAMR